MARNSVLTRLSSWRHFVEVAREESFRRAADKMNIAPSAVSKQVKNLEAAIGTELFVRRRGRAGLELTEAGRILLFRCASAMNELDIATEEINALKGLQRGHLRLGVNEVLATDLLHDIIGNLHRNFPGLQYTIFVENTPEIVRRLHDGDIDVGLGYNVPFSPEIEILATLHRNTYLITALDHRLARRSSVRLEELAGEKFIFPDPSVGLYQMLQDAIVRSGIDVKPIMHTNSFTLLRQMVQNGLGVGMVIGRFLQHTTEKLAFVKVENHGIERKPLSCCRAAGRIPTISSEAFVASVKSLFAQYGG